MAIIFIKIYTKIKIMLSINSTHCTHLKSNAFENGQLMSFRDPYLYGSFRHWRCGGEGDTHLCPRGPSVSDNGGHTLSPQGLSHTHSGNQSSQLPTTLVTDPCTHFLTALNPLGIAWNRNKKNDCSTCTGYLERCTSFSFPLVNTVI